MYNLFCIKQMLYFFSHQRTKPRNDALLSTSGRKQWKRVKRKKERVIRRIWKSSCFLLQTQPSTKAKWKNERKTRELLTHTALFTGVHRSVRRSTIFPSSPMSLSSPFLRRFLTTRHKALRREFLRILLSGWMQELIAGRNSTVEDNASN